MPYGFSFLTAVRISTTYRPLLFSFKISGITTSLTFLAKEIWKKKIKKKLQFS